MTTINNSGGKTLLGNWVEERGSAPFEDTDIGIAAIGTQGHKGILTTKFDANAEKLTTVRDSYRQPGKLGIRQTGSKLEQLEKALYEKISAEVHEEFNPPPPPPEFISTTKNDFTSDYVHEEIEPVMHHNYEVEQPVSYWSENYRQVHGVSQTKTSDTPFRKNAAFSTPISEYQDSPKPYENWKF